MLMSVTGMFRIQCTSKLDANSFILLLVHKVSRYVAQAGFRLTILFLSVE